VAEAGERLGLGPEAGAGVGVEVAEVREGLDGDVPAQLPLAGLVDDPHAAAAE
jgi:hypothetical protein